MTESEICLPLSEAHARRLRVGDIVRVNGAVHTMRDMGHRRVIEMMQTGRRIPFDLDNGAVWHCGPIARKVKDKWEIVAAGPTSSSRFTELGAKLVKNCHVRLTIGKGTMGTAAVSALKEVGAVYLVATGGCAVVYAKQIARVENVHWLDLGMPEATWVLRVNNLGPLVVGIDSNGDSLAKAVFENARTKIQGICRAEKVDPVRGYVWWPKSVVGSKGFVESLKMTQ